MSITIDDATLDAPGLGLNTVGEVLSHVARGNRLVVQLLIDGSEPDLARMEDLRARSVKDCSLFIETVQPQAICCDVLDGIDDAMAEANTHRETAASLFREGKPSEALQKLAACFATWQHAQESLAKVAKLLRADLSRVRMTSGQTVEELLTTFAADLRQLRDGLETRDHTLCCDVLTYDMEHTTDGWTQATTALRALAGR